MKKSIENKLDSASPVSFSFSGCGFLGLYHVGVASCLREYGPITPKTKIAGASAGALASMALVCDLPLGESASEILQVAIKARARALGPFHPSFDINTILYDALVKTLPDDAHLRATGRLYISLTRVSDGENVIISDFKSKEELIKAVQCSCFIPLWSGLVPPKFNGVAYIDGGCSDNLPILDKNTVTVSPFAGESDICPQDDTYSLFQISVGKTSIALTPANLYRISRILFPAHPETLSQMCQQGFDDALRFLQRNNKISCTRCLAIHFTLEKENCEKTQASGKHHHLDKQSLKNCRDCEYRRQMAILDSLPEPVVQAIQEACDQVNKGLINWLFRYRPMKLLSILSIPALLPIDITIVLFSKIYQRLPDIKAELRASFMRLISHLKSLLVQMEDKRSLYSAKFSCQLAVKEFDYISEECSSPLNKIRKTSTISARSKKSIQIAPSSKIEKSNSFAGRKSSNFINDIDRVDNKINFFREAFNLEKNRKISYAGREASKSFPHRRRSMIEISYGNNNSQRNSSILKPERVLSQLNFDFKLDMNETFKSEPRIDQLESRVAEKLLNIDISEIDQSNAIEIAKKAIDWEKNILQKCQSQLNSDGNSFEKMLEITKKHDAVMAFYYQDNNNQVKVTEVFNISDEDLRNLSSNNSQQDIPVVYKDKDDGLFESSILQRLPPDSNFDSQTSSTKLKRHKSSRLNIDGL